MVCLVLILLLFRFYLQMTGAVGGPALFCNCLFLLPVCSATHDQRLGPAQIVHKASKVCREMKRQNSTLWASQALVIKLKKLEKSTRPSAAVVTCRYNLKAKSINRRQTNMASRSWYSNQNNIFLRICFHLQTLPVWAWRGPSCPSSGRPEDRQAAQVLDEGFCKRTQPHKFYLLQ